MNLNFLFDSCTDGHLSPHLATMNKAAMDIQEFMWTYIFISLDM